MVRISLLHAAVLAAVLALAGLTPPSPVFAQTGSETGDAASGPLTPRLAGTKKSLSELQAMPQTNSVIVKFREGLVVRKRGNALSGLAGGDSAALNKAVSALDLPMSSFERLHAVIPEATLDEQRELGQRNTGKQLADLNLYYTVPVPPGQTAAEVANSLNTLDFIEFAEPAPTPAPAPVDIAPATPDFSAQQTYKGAAPGGINVDSLDGLPGADGTGIRIVDVEYSWQLDHEDLELPGSRVINVGAAAVDPFNSTDHGTAVMGQMVGKDNGYGVTGIVPASQGFVAAANTTLGYNPATAIAAASAAILPGDVILIEQQFTACGTADFGPLEVRQDVFDATSNATAAGRIVVAAAGNGSLDLDRPSCNGLFNRNVRDSGAIIVGAGTSFSQARLGFSSYGSRVDVQGWGHFVVTTGYGVLFDGGGDVRQFYTQRFSGTSSASPIVAGAVAAIQGRLAACGQPKLTPAQMRAKLVQFGTAQSDPQNGNIGPLPNVGRTLASYSCGPGPDLVISGFSRSASSVTSNQPVTLNATVTNQGNEPSSPTTLRYYLSSDSNISNIDTELDSDALAALLAGGSSAQNTDVTINFLGNFWIGACVDSFAGETDISNNCSAGFPITITSPIEPDLVISSIGVSNAMPRIGEPFTINATARNSGSAAAPASTLRYMSSSDANIGFNDTELDTDPIPGLAIGSSSAQNTTASLPRAGTSWIGACVDRVPGESGANNNCSNAVQVTVDKGDTAMSLIAQVQATTLASPATWGTRVELTARITSVAPAVGVPGGRLEFYSDTQFLGRVRMRNGVAVLTTTALTLGTHRVQVRYNGTANWNGSTSPWQNITISAALGGEFRVNRTTANHQQAPSVAANSQGEFLAAWQSLEQDGSSWGVYAQRFNANARRRGPEISVNRVKARAQAVPSVAALENRGYVVVFEGARADGNNFGIRAQRFTRDGAKRGNPFTVNTFVRGQQRAPYVAGLQDGGFIVVWQSRGQDGSGWGIYAQRHRASGAKFGSEFRVNTTTSGHQLAPVVTALNNGGYVIAWQSLNQDGSEHGIYAQRYRADNTSRGGEIQVNSTTANDQTNPAIAALADGGFVVGWQSQRTDGSDLGIYAQRFRANGTVVGPEQQVNTNTNGRQFQPALIGLDDNGYLVTWSSKNQDGSGFGIFAQRYDSTNSRQDVEFQVNMTTQANQMEPAGTNLNAATAAIIWASRNQDGSGFGIYGQRLDVQ